MRVGEPPIRDLHLPPCPTPVGGFIETKTSDWLEFKKYYAWTNKRALVPGTSFAVEKRRRGKTQALKRPFAPDDSANGQNAWNFRQV